MMLVTLNLLALTLGSFQEILCIIFRAHKQTYQIAFEELLSPLKQRQDEQEKWKFRLSASLLKASDFFELKLWRGWPATLIRGWVSEVLNKVKVLLKYKRGNIPWVQWVNSSPNILNFACFLINFHCIVLLCAEFENAGKLSTSFLKNSFQTITFLCVWDIS